MDFRLISGLYSVSSTDSCGCLGRSACLQWYQGMFAALRVCNMTVLFALLLSFVKLLIYLDSVSNVN
ncbi:hypothetical protein T01_2891 [Trichinella spiralis]|uniref:Uncharacterized protein n=2 Tax=Trichinella spiralis TaxID=6334 RepID=A0A0V0ZUU8_TRISP|nr:hypothetical protein T01_2891 [Trichinella spiralis]